jgi:hypothetical protein
VPPWLLRNAFPCHRQCVTTLEQRVRKEMLSRCSRQPPRHVRHVSIRADCPSDEGGRFYVDLTSVGAPREI